jgi:chondroitin AC lyase
MVAQFMNGVCDTYVCQDASGILASQFANGSFPGINYADQSRNSWDPVQHWNKVGTMAASMHCPCSDAAGGAFPPNSSFVASIHQASTFWYANPWIKSENWWWPDIGLPMSLARAYILFYDNLYPTEVTNSSLIFLNADWQHGNPETWSGQNNQWGQEIEVWRGVVSQNTTAIDEGFSAMWAALRVIPASANPDNGMHADGSFHQHGPLLQTGTYGAGFSGDVLQLLPLVSGLTWDLSDAAREALVFYTLEGQRPTVRWNGQSGENAAAFWDVNVKGREITRPPSGSCQFSSSWADTLPLLSPASQARHDEMIAWVASFTGQSKQHVQLSKYFWLSDYLSVSTQDFSIGIRTHSTRTFSSECVNSENLQGWHQSAGFVSVRRTGDEYSRRDSIFPVWNYTLLPGVTARQVADEKECSTVKQMGLSSFVGGAADGVAGASAYAETSNDFGGESESTHLTARKSYLVSDFGLAVIISNGTLDTAQAVATTLTSAMAPASDAPAGMQPAVGTLQTPSGAPVPAGDTSYPASTVAWAASDGVVYAPIPLSACAPEPASLETNTPTFEYPVHTVSGSVNGSWQRISTSQSPAPVSRSIFSAFLAHGSIASHPIDLAYVALPSNVSANEAEAAVASAQASITASACATSGNGIAAVHTLRYTDKETGLVTMSATAFPATAQAPAGAATLSAPGVGITGITHPSAWLVRETASGVSITVSDPTNTAGSSGLRVNATLAGVQASMAMTAPQLVGATKPSNYDGIVSATEWAGAGISCTPNGANTDVSVVLPMGINMAGSGITVECPKA